MRLFRIDLRGYQSYWAEQSVTVADRVTLVAGRNNVGKTSLLRALHVVHRGSEGAREDFRIGYSWSMTGSDLHAIVSAGPQPTTGSVAAYVHAEAQVTLETSFRLAQPLSAGSGALYCERVVVDAGPGARFTATAPAGSPVQMGWSTGISPLNGQVSDVRRLTTWARGYVEATAFLAPRSVPHGSRILGPVPDLTPNAANLADVWSYMATNEPDRLDAMQAVIRDAFPEVTRVLARVTTAGTQEAELYVHFVDLHDPVPLRLCGTGIEQMLAIVTTVLGGEPPRLVLIDEPQAYLHPHAERTLLALLDATPQHQYIVTSHSATLLRARPISDACLITRTDEGSRIAALADEGHFLDEVGLTAADLWLNEDILWVEGPTERTVLGMIADARLEPLQRNALAIREMPQAASRFATRNAKQALAAYQFCSETTVAVAPLPVRMRFLFDRDEYGSEFRAKIIDASRGSARFLPRREIENFFLVPSAVHNVLSNTCALFDISPPALSEIERRIAVALGDTENRRLFPAGPPERGQEHVAIKASTVLDDLWNEVLLVPYDKVRDGAELAGFLLRSEPAALEPLCEIVVETGVGDRRV